MRFVVYGAGAIGGVVGGRLFQNGFDVVLIARGEHYSAIRDDGLRVESPDDRVTLGVPVVARPAEVGVTEGDIVLLAVKSQNTAQAVTSLAEVASPSPPVCCLQNGVDNERTVLRRFANVYAVGVMCPAGHLEPGVVQAYSSPTSGILDLGRYPGGVDDVAAATAVAFRASTFDAEARPDMLRWKYAKLLTNLGNAVEAVCGPEARRGALTKLAREEGVACLVAAGIDFASEEEDRARRGDLLHVRPIAGRRRPGGSSWQSLARRARAIETDYLNGEIVLLGRLHGVPTPVNDALQRLANDMAARGDEPGAVPAEDLLARLGG